MKRIDAVNAPYENIGDSYIPLLSLGTAAILYGSTAPFGCCCYGAVIYMQYRKTRSGYYHLKTYKEAILKANFKDQMSSDKQ